MPAEMDVLEDDHLAINALMCYDGWQCCMKWWPIYLVTAISDFCHNRHNRRLCIFTSRGPFLHRENASFRPILAFCCKFTHLLVFFTGLDICSGEIIRYGDFLIVSSQWLPHGCWRLPPVSLVTACERDVASGDGNLPWGNFGLSRLVSIV